MDVIASILVVLDPPRESLDDLVTQLVNADARVIVLFCNSELGAQILLHSYQVNPCALPEAMACIQPFLF